MVSLLTIIYLTSDGRGRMASFFHKLLPAMIVFFSLLIPLLELAGLCSPLPGIADRLLAALYIILYLLYNRRY